MKTTIYLFSFLILLGASPKVQAYSSDEEGLSYDSIVNKLSKPAQEALAEPDPLDLVKFHPTVGMTDTFFTLDYPNGNKTYIDQKGFMAALGIDLFSPEWISEMGLISFGSQQYGPSNITMQEFFLKVIYKTEISRALFFRLGGGISARYMTVAYSGLDNGTPTNYSTPSSLFSSGLEAKITEKFSLGAEVAGHASLIDETPERSSLNLTLRIDGNF